MTKNKAVGYLSHVEIVEPKELCLFELKGKNCRWRAEVDCGTDGFMKASPFDAVQDAIFHLSKRLDVSPDGFRLVGELPQSAGEVPERGSDERKQACQHALRLLAKRKAAVALRKAKTN